VSRCWCQYRIIFSLTWWYANKGECLLVCIIKFDKININVQLINENVESRFCTSTNKIFSFFRHHVFLKRKNVVATVELSVCFSFHTLNWCNKLKWNKHTYIYFTSTYCIMCTSSESAEIKKQTLWHLHMRKSIYHSLINYLLMPHII